MESYHAVSLELAPRLFEGAAFELVHAQGGVLELASACEEDGRRCKLQEEAARVWNESPWSGLLAREGCHAAANLLPVDAAAKEGDNHLSMQP